MRVEIDNASGFCNGVVTAIRKAEHELDNSANLYCLGDIVHNSDEVERLCRRGLVTITHDDLATLNGVKVLLRAHGEPPSTYATAKANDIQIIDATCPVVLHLQKRIKESYDNRTPGQQIVIYGKKGHAEVNGLVGQTNGEAIVVEDISGLDRLDFSRDIILYSQTTKSVHGFHEMIDEIEHRKSPDTDFKYVDTICRQVANRVPQLRAFAAEHQVILFVSGLKSSNGRFLYGECRDVNPNTFFISTPDEIQAQWFDGVDSIGICGATSTPRWLMEQVRDKVNAFCHE
jgi:4-hydroxy-3-methylbut-2-enyl diphosphate reductase